jgi:hypothetical protein
VIESDFKYSDQKIHTTEDKIEYLNFDHMLQHAKFTLGLGELPLSCMIHDIYHDYPILIWGTQFLKDFGVLQPSLSSVSAFTLLRIWID